MELDLSLLTGLTDTQAAALRFEGKGNNVKLKESRSYLDIILQNTFAFLNTVLFALGVVLLLMGRTTDAIMSSGLVLLNVLIGVFQESRAKYKLDQIALLNRPKVTLIRGGSVVERDPAEIVLGDLLILRAGDQILCDGRIASLAGGRIEVDESLLTGESDLILKRVGDSLYSGSYCVSGEAVFEAQRVGAESFAGQITAGARVFRSSKTPLQRQINLILRLLMLPVIFGGGLLIMTSIIENVPVVESVQMGTVVTSLIPNGLIVMVTIAYAMGAVRMAGKGALIQETNAVESLSNVDVLCMDKTGTITANALTLKQVLPALGDEETVRREMGDFARSASSRNHTIEALDEGCTQGSRQPVIAEAPFSSARKWSGLAFAGGVYVLGAAESLQAAMTIPENLELQVRAWEKQGLRALLFASKEFSLETPEEKAQVFGGDEVEVSLPEGLQVRAAICFADQLRQQVGEAVAAFRELGVQVKIISGDNPNTVAALAKQAGIGGDLPLISGEELAELDDAGFEQMAEKTGIFGRITPQQKERLVESLKKHGHYVAMIGDGVNDVLSLKKAQLGIAMHSGSQAARGVADIVLLEDSFAALIPAIREGQRIRNGMQDIVKLFLTRVVYQMLLIAGVMVLERSFPLSIRHVSLISLLTVGIPTFFLAIWARPGKPRLNLIQSILHFVLPAGMTISVFAFGIFVLFSYLVFPDGPDTLLVARSASAIFMAIAGICLVVLVEPPLQWLAGGDEIGDDWKPTILAGVMLVLLVIVLATPALRDSFDIVQLGVLPMALVLVISAVWAWCMLQIWRKQLVYKYLDIEPLM